MNKKIIYLVRKEKLCIAHRLYNDKLSHQENINLYDKCINIHGHNFTLFVTIKAKINDETGMVMNFKELKTIIKENVFDKMDHKYLNADIEEFKTLVPTAENVAYVIWQWLAPKLDNLHEIKLEETDNNTTIYRGE
ncbi:MAG: 6-pyruvoyl trahydropterin synthase family protein [Rickettsiales bacterium]